MPRQTPTPSQTGRRAPDVATLVVDLSGLRVAEASPALGALVGRPCATVIGRPFSDLWMPSERAAIRRRLDSAVAYDRDIASALALRVKDGGRVLVEMDARYVRLPDERILVRLTPIEDAESVARTEVGAAGAETESMSWDPDNAGARAGLGGPDGLAASVLEMADIGVLFVAADGRIVLATSHAAHLLGRTPEQLNGLECDELFASSQDAVHALRYARSEMRRQTARAEATSGPATGRSAQRREFNLRWLPLGGDREGALLIEPVAPEDPEAARMRHAVWLLDTGAHDIFNALASIESGLSNLRRDRELEPQRVRVLERLTERCEYVVAILESILGKARGTATTQVFDLAQLLADLAETTAAAHDRSGIEVRVAVEGDALVRADALCIQRAFENLVNNAVQAMPRGGTLTLGLRREDRESPGVLATVTDTGVGIRPEDLQRVFVARVRADDTRPGAGLGLDIVSRLVVDAGGEVDVTSVVGRGSTFFVWLPLAGSEAPRALRAVPGG